MQIVPGPSAPVPQPELIYKTSSLFHLWVVFKQFSKIEKRYQKSFPTSSKKENIFWGRQRMLLCPKSSSSLGASVLLVTIIWRPASLTSLVKNIRWMIQSHLVWYFDFGDYHHHHHHDHDHHPPLWLWQTRILLQKPTALQRFPLQESEQKLFDPPRHHY